MFTLKQSRFPLIGVLTALLLILSSCTPAEPSPPEPVEEGPPAATAIPPTATLEPTPEILNLESEAEGACQHPFYPIRSDTTWTYLIHSPEADEEGQFSLSYAEITEESFQSTMSLQDRETGEIFTATATWYCDESGLISSEYATINFTQFEGLDFETLDYEGVYLLPAEEWEVGASWNSSYQVKADFSMEGISVNTDMEIDILNTIAGIEEVTVSAGTFPEAYRVDSTGTISIDLGGDVGAAFSDLPLDYSTWYVEGVGMVRQETMDETMGGGTTELYSVE